jgi:ATP-binding cassette, subfamily B, bacterial
MNNSNHSTSLLDRFPALRGLGSKYRARQIPYIQQLSATECGAACLAMVLGYYGKRVSVDQICEAIGVDRNGANALSILEGGRWYGLRGRGIKIDIDDLAYLKPASILHWEFNHFVVFENLGRDGANIVNPGLGRCFVPMEKFSRSFTGVALEFEPADDFQPVGRESSVVWRYVKQIIGHSRILSRIAVTSLLIQFFALAVPVVTGILVDRVVPHGDEHLLMVLSVGLLSIALFHFLASIIRAHLLLNLRTYLDTKMTFGFLDHMVALPYAFFQRRSVGDLMMRLNSNSTIRELITSNALSGLLDGVLVTLYLIILFFASASMGALVLGLGLMQLLLFLLSRRRYQDLMSQHLQSQARSQSYLVQILAGIETLKASGAEERAVERWSNLFVDEMNVSLDRGRLSATVDSLMITLRMASPLVILWFGGLQVLNGSMTLGTMLALNALAGSFLLPLSNLISTGLELQLLGSYIERIEDVFKTPPEQDRSKVSRAGSLRGRITLERVSFKYGPMSPAVVQDVSIEIIPGQKIAIVGRSGAGKSSLAKLMVGLYSPTTGCILYDGLDLSGIDLRSVRSLVGVVTQRPYLFGLSIRANIALTDPSLPLQSVVEAAKAACIHDDIMAMPMGYETLLNDGGMSLSGGQSQRVALARALFHKPAILLLDEATSQLDTVTEREVHRNIASLRCTRIVIAHRLSTIIDSDLILVMEDGKVVEKGTHQELLALGGKYRELVSAQIEGEPGVATPYR